MIKILWGSFDTKTGAWVPNPTIPMTPEDQNLINVANGFTCGECGKMKGRCSCFSRGIS